MEQLLYAVGEAAFIQNKAFFPQKPQNSATTKAKLLNPEVTSHQNNGEGWKHGTIDHVFKTITGCLQGASEAKVLR